MHPLDGPILKINRVKGHIETIREAADVLRKEADIRVVPAELNPKTGKHAIRVMADAEPSLYWGLWVGEIAHNLRSALDNLVWQLALLKTRTPAGNTQFPIFHVGQTRRRRPRGGLIPHFEREGRRMIRDLLREHQVVIERLQPYKRQNGGKNNPLYLLHEINNADKHRLLQTVASLPTGYFITHRPGLSLSAPPDVRLRFTALVDGAKVGEIAAADLQKVDVNQNVMPLICFWEGCVAVKRLLVVPTLREIANHVSEIVESFRPEFT